MHSFDQMVAGTPLPELRVTVSANSNQRYWRAAGADHLLLSAGTLYPPIAANLTVLCFGRVCAEPVIQTRQRLVCHRLGSAGSELVTRGEVVAHYDKRGRAYVDIAVTVTTADAPAEPLWTSEVSFTPAATLSNP